MPLTLIKGNSNMKTSRAGLDLIKKFEGCKLTAYRDPVGILTIGWGHTTKAGLPKVLPGLKITQAQADDILASDLVKFEVAVDRAVTVPMRQNQFDAMVSLCFNIGPTAFAASSVARNINAGRSDKAGNSFLLWTRSGGKVLPGLVRRRNAEKALFEKAAA
jgi:lysozyme